MHIFFSNDYVIKVLTFGCLHLILQTIVAAAVTIVAMVTQKLDVEAKITTRDCFRTVRK